MNLSVNQGYTFNIIGYDQWPSVSIKYAFKNIGPIPQLQLNFKFDTDSYLPQTDKTDTSDTEVPAWQQNAAHALVAFKNIQYQLNWLYVSDEKPDEQIRVIKHAATTTLCPAQPISFADEDLARLSKFVKTIINWLQRLTDSIATSIRPTRTPVMKPVLLPVTGTLEQKNIFEIGISLIISRIDADTNLQVSQASKAILPDIKTGVSLKAGQKAFAQNFETAFKTLGSWLKLSVGRGNYNNATQLWAVRWADGDTGNGISYSVNPETATSFAPAPLSKNPISGSVNISPYTSGQGIDPNAAKTDLQFQHIDLDGWITIFLQSIDQVLAPATMDAVLTCVTLNTLQQPDRTNPLQEMLATKAAIAGQLVKMLAPVVTEQTGNLNDAIKYLTGQLNQGLENFYEGTAIVQFNASVAANSGADIVNLYGKIASVSDKKSASFADALIPNTANSTVSFVVKAKKTQRQSYLPVSVTYQPTGLDYQFDEGIIIPLSFSIPPAAHSTVLSANVPMVLRAYPQPPVVSNQTTEKTYADEVATLQNVKLYDYIYQYNQPAAAQDIVETKLIINGAALPMVSGYGHPNNLFENLAQFIQVYPQITADLETSLPLINKETTVDSKAYQVALPALIAMAELTSKVKSALSTTNATLNADELSPIPETSYSFTIQLMPVKPVTDNRLLIQVTAKKSQPAPLSLPLMLIDGYDAVLFDTVENDTNISKSYIYVSAERGPMIFDGSLTNLPTEIKFPGFDVLSAEKLNLVINETRNKNLLPNPNGGYYTTDERFIYTLPQNNNIQEVIPALFWNNVEFDIASLNPTTVKASLQDCLQLLFNNIFGNTNSVAYNTMVKVTYEYKVDDGDFLPGVSLPVLLIPAKPLSNTNKNDFAQYLYREVKIWLDNVNPGGIKPRLYLFTSLKQSGMAYCKPDKLYFNLSDVN
jgi:hypothetical protein